MSSNYIFTEPAPSTTTYMRSGRGGAGNTYRASSSSSSSSAQTKNISPPSPSSATRRFFSGIGGAGNVHEADKQRRPELLRSLDDGSTTSGGLLRDQPPSVGYCGRGGAGNVYRRKTSDASSDAASVASNASSVSAKAKMWVARLSGSSS